MSPIFGVSLIEVMVAIFILSLLLLEFDVMQVNAVKATEANYDFGVAVQQLSNMQDYLSSIKAADFSDYLKEWNRENKIVLPQGYGAVVGSYPHFTLTIFWGNHKQESCAKNKIGLTGCLSKEINF